MGGYLMDSFGINVMFASFSVLLTITTIVILTQYPARGAKRSRPAGDIQARSFCSFEVVWFFCNLFIYGMNMALVETFLFIFLLRDFVGATSFLLGSTIAVMCLFEMPVFFYVDRLFGRLQLTTLLSFCHFVFALRCVLYVSLPRNYPMLVLLVEPLHGITFAVMWSTAVEYGKRLAPAGSEAKMQALINGLYYQLAIGVGSSIWGYLTELPPKGIGFPASFLSAAAVMITWSFIWNLGWLLYRRTSAREPLLSDVACEGRT